MATLIRGARVVGPKTVEKKNILIRGGKIAGIGNGRAPKGATIIDADGLYALPGFVDVHVHGGIGFDPTMGEYDMKTGKFDPSPEAYARVLPTLMKHYAKHGVTRVLLATLAAPMKELQNAYGNMARYAESDRNGMDGTFCEGIFVEGCFIKNPEYSGAQNPANFMAPAMKTFNAMQKAARGWIKYVNIVPEYGKAAEKVIAAVTKSGVTVGMAHTSERAVQVRKCAEAGLKICQHLLNGPTGTSFKPFGDGNVLEEVLTNPNLKAELICDGWHISPRYVVDVFRRMGFDRIVVVSDATFLANKKGVDKFELGGVKGRVGPKGEYLQVVGKTDTLFGSVLTMDKGFSNILSWQTSGMAGIWSGKQKPTPLNQALLNTAKATATNPAKLIGLDRTRKTGTLAKGKCADIILADLKGKPGKYSLKIKKTFVCGKKV
jgi:N-acetylglucosamine-6-phosphate deacetylase